MRLATWLISRLVGTPAAQAIVGDLVEAAGLPLGWFLALVVARLIAGFLPGLSPTDPTTFVVATVSVLGTSVLACLPPAVRATRWDPVTALRSD